MLPQPLFLTLIPSSSKWCPVSIAFLDTENIQLQIGGSRREWWDDLPLPSSPFRFNGCAVHPNHASLFCCNGSIQLLHGGRGGMTCLNGHSLDPHRRIHLHDGDTVEFGQGPWRQGTNEFELRFQVRVSVSSPAFPPTQLHGGDSVDIVSATAGFLHRLDDLHSLTTRTAQELAATQDRLRQALRAADDHVCVTPPSPRPYGALLQELRVRTQDPLENTVSQPSSPGASAVVTRIESSLPPPSPSPTSLRPSSVAPIDASSAQLATVRLSNSDDLSSKTAPTFSPPKLCTSTMTVQSAELGVVSTNSACSSTAAPFSIPVPASELTPVLNKSFSADGHDGATLSSAATENNPSESTTAAASDESCSSNETLCTPLGGKDHCGERTPAGIGNRATKSTSVLASVLADSVAPPSPDSTQTPYLASSSSRSCHHHAVKPPQSRAPARKSPDKDRLLTAALAVHRVGTAWFCARQALFHASTCPTLLEKPLVTPCSSSTVDVNTQRLSSTGDMRNTDARSTPTAYFKGSGAEICARHSTSMPSAVVPSPPAESLSPSIMVLNTAPAVAAPLHEAPSQRGSVFPLFPIAQSLHQLRNSFPSFYSFCSSPHTTYYQPHLLSYPHHPFPLARSLVPRY
ncbi:hypothetical protein A4X13_0g8699 [Tilletia indica]|uniref:FHA domain-containing protein n=1 Tax=Tilletia indica TaxID=43049 RepID=A0A177T252_9BASI|nr:hypothetical protein A4X13_0g8699 [Tilletia indica]